MAQNQIQCIKDWSLTPEKTLFRKGELYKITKEKINKSTGVVSYQISGIWFHSGSEYFKIGKDE